MHRSSRFFCFFLIALFHAKALAQPQEVTVTVPIAVTPAEAWTKLSDFSLAHNYVPGLSDTRIMSERREGVGAHRRVYDEDGGFLEETIIAWLPQQGFTLKLHDGEEPMFPFERAEFRYAISADDDNNTLMQLSLLFEMPLGTVGFRLGDWFVRPVIEDQLVQVAAGIKYFYETGAPANDGTRAENAGAVLVTPATDMP
tara:strand:- start:54111 stop:54707 length:597 start_codon:yes stop_codon:yes gene_type:complete